MKTRFSAAKLFISVAACVFIGSLGAIFTSPKIATWYSTLAKPSWTPPNWAFGPVWTTLFVLMGFALYLVWQKYPRTRGSRLALQLFVVQFALNVLWSLLFFGLESPLYGLLGIASLWLAITATIVQFYKVSKPAAYVLVPYIVWVTVAAALNYSVYVLSA